MTEPPRATEAASSEAAASKFTSCQWEILERIARGASLSQLLGSIVSLVEHQAEHMFCAIQLLEGQHLRPAAALRLPAELHRYIDGLRIGPHAGSCGAAAFLGETVIVTDIETHPDWAEYKQPFLEHGLHACWSTPISSPAGDVLGTLAMYFPEKRGPTADERTWVDAATHLAAIALTRAQSEQENQRLLHDLGERVKELTLLQKSAGLLQADHRDPRELLTELVELLPSGWQYPELCQARILWNDLDIRTSGFRETPYKQAASASAGEHTVRVEVVYSSETPMQAEGPFLLEERNLIQSLADLLSAYLERHRAEQALQGTLSELRDAHQRLKFHVSHMPLAYIVWDRDFTVTEWNAAAERIFGWTASEAIGRQGSDLIVPSGAATTTDPLREEMSQSDQSGARGTHENVRKDGQRLVCEWFHVPLRNKSGQVIGYLSMANDVTERKRAEEARTKLEGQLRQAQRMQALGTLTGGIAHDFNNILTAITGHTYLALTDLEEERSTKDSLLAIQEASLRAVELVRRILTFSRRQAPERSNCPLQPIVEDALQLLRSTLPPSITIRSRYADATPPIFADASQVHQAIMNVGTNAAYAIGEHGVIDVVVEPVPASHDDLIGVANPRFTQYVRVSINDTGSGMDEATAERIFEPFFTTKPAGQATGLGLSVVHGIMKGHEGTIFVHSEPGRGSSFQLYFPEAKAPGESPSAAPAGPPQSPQSGLGTGLRVLYVDDEEPLVVLATRWLVRLGHYVTGFSDSSLALEAFRAHPEDFDAVITDLSMPGLSGADLAREVLSIRPGIIVVMSSGYIRPEDQQLAKELGAMDVVLKPQSMAEFGRILHLVLESHGSARPRA